MKKYITIFIGVLLPLWLCAEPVDVETALQKATDFLMQHPSSRGRHMAPANRSLRLLHTQRQTDDEAPTLYVFGNEGSEGFVVIAGDDIATSPVLGYSSKGKFNVDNIPCNLRYLLDEYGRQLAYARKHPSSMKTSPSNTSREAILPLTTSKWHQHEPFNNLCPIDEGDRCSTGCVATALAQIMYYHKWPEQGVGSYTYDWEWHDQTISADFGATTYQWDKMKDTYNGDDDDPDDAVATLMFHCGVATDTQYRCDGSMVLMENLKGRLEERIEKLLVNFFNYSYSPNDIQMDKAELDEIENILYDELSAQRPSIIIGGEHAFICDGYDNGYFHFNFGWGGYCDDYYLLSAITPSSYDFSSNMIIIYQIMKPGDENRVEIDGILYELYTDGTASLIHGEPKGDYEVPLHIQMSEQEYKVTAIGNRAFANCRGLYSVTIPNSVTSIGNAAFRNCDLQSVTIPNSVISIGDAAFMDCWCLNSVTIPNSITAINKNAFNGCYNMVSVLIPESITSIGNNAFYNCHNLTSLTIPKNVRFIGKNAFQYCQLVSIQVDNDNTVYDSRDNCNALIETASNTLILGSESSFIPNGVTSIGDEAFQLCDNLTSIIIPNSVSSIGYAAFYQCMQLTSIEIPSSVMSISDFAFWGCENLTSVTIHDGVKSIGTWVFGSCYNLSAITIPNSVTTLGAATFRCCSNLSSITLSNSLKRIDNLLFENCGNLKTVIIPNSVTTIGIAAFYCCGITSITLPDGLTHIENFGFENCANLTSLSIPNSITSIDMGAFSGCSGLSSIIIPDGIETIKAGLFMNCSNLKTVSIPNSVTKIESVSDGSIMMGAFSGCVSLEKIILPDNLSVIEAETFINCNKLSSITIPKSVTFIGERAFQDCNSLMTVTSKTETPVSISSDVFTNRTSATLYVPYGCKEAYEDAEYWKEFKEIIEMPKLMGNVNGDGEVDIADAVCIVNHIVGKPTQVFISPAADVNNDGEIDIADAVRIVNLIVGKIETLARQRGSTELEPE